MQIMHYMWSAILKQRFHGIPQSHSIVVFFSFSRKHREREKIRRNTQKYAETPKQYAEIPQQKHPKQNTCFYSEDPLEKKLKLLEN